MNKKKLFLAVGPSLAALVIVGFIFYSPFTFFKKPSANAVHDSASSMSIHVLKGNALRKEAMFTNDYLPFFGSSELSRINSFHPSVMAKKYNRDYDPYLLGAPGSQSLTHFFSLNSLKDELNGKKAVFIISPQWFVKDGVSDPMFTQYFSPLQIDEWMMNANPENKESQYLANRLLHFSSIKEDSLIKKTAEKIKDGKALDTFDKKWLDLDSNMLKKEDLLFSTLQIKSKDKKIEREAKKLPNDYSYDTLEKLAFEIGQKQTDNNEFEIANNFYTKRIKPKDGKLKDSQIDFDYLSSPEFGDFQLVLNQIAENNMDVLFVIPPVNKKWSDYTGLSHEMLETFSKKINYQLASQGFNHVADYTDKNAEPYFMEDTIHLGWRGWLNLDRDVQEFLSDESNPTYQLKQNLFFSEEWKDKRDF